MSCVMAHQKFVTSTSYMMHKRNCARLAAAPRNFSLADLFSSGKGSEIIQRCSGIDRASPNIPDYAHLLVLKINILSLSAVPATSKNPSRPCGSQ